MKRFSFFESLFGENMFSLFNFENMDFPKETDTNFNKVEETIETETHDIKKETWTSTDGKSKYVRTYAVSKQNRLEPKKEDLQKLLDKAVEDQDFEKAIELRDKIKKM